MVIAKDAIKGGVLMHFLLLRLKKNLARAFRLKLYVPLSPKILKRLLYKVPQK